LASVICLASGKGGVGKTTSVANIAVALGRRGLDVLVWDLDGQGNLGQGLGVDLATVRASSYHLLTGRAPLSAALHETAFEGVTLVPSHMELFAAEQELGGGVGKEFIVRDLLRTPEASRFDIVLIDLPPNLGFHTVNGFAAGRWVLIPLQMSGFALAGLRQLAYAIRLAQEHLNPELELLGLVPTFVNARTNFSRELVDALHMIPNTRVFQPYVPYTVRVAEGSLTGVPVVVSAPQNPAAQAYVNIADRVWEVIQASPAHVTRAPAPAIAPPPRAPSLTGGELAEAGARAAAAAGTPRRRRGLFDFFRRLQRSAS
jgi:chromosome partitioning protein